MCYNGDDLRGVYMNLVGLDSEQLYSREDILKEMERHNEVFSLDTFYVNDPSEFVPNYTGYKVITKDREYSGYCYPYSASHEDTLEKVLYALYGNDYNKIYMETNFNFRETAALLGAVFVQMLSKYYTLVWVPSKLNEFQCNTLLNFLSDMSKVNERLDKGITIKACIKKEDGSFFECDMEEAFTVLPSLVVNKKRM